MTRKTNLHVLLDGGLESSGVGTNDGSNLLTILEEDESGHGADAELLSDLGDLVDIDLVEAGAGVGRGHPVLVRARISLVCRQKKAGWLD